MNLALGAKIIWRIVTGKGAWWKEIVQKKYLNGIKKRCVDNINMDRKGSSIWDLCKNIAHILIEQLKWTPGNDKAIKIWHVHCSSVPPIVLAQAFQDLRHYLESRNLHTLFDISDWTSKGRWFGLRDMEIGQLNVDYRPLITVLPPLIHHELKDERCWGKYGSYTVKA